MKYIYDKNLKLITTVYDEISDKDIKKVYDNHYIVNEYIKYPKLVNGKIEKMSDSEISKHKYKEYMLGKYNLKYNEIIGNEVILEYQVNDYEKIENGVVIFDYEAKRENLLRKTKVYEQSEKEAPFEFKGYIQPNRELEDQTSLLKILSFMQMTKQSHFSNWKMKDINGHEHYIDLTIEEMMELAIMMQEQTTRAMYKWSSIRERIKAMSDEEIMNYKLER